MSVEEYRDYRSMEKDKGDGKEEEDEGLMVDTCRDI